MVLLVTALAFSLNRRVGTPGHGPVTHRRHRGRARPGGCDPAVVSRLFEVEGSVSAEGAFLDFSGSLLFFAGSRPGPGARAGARRRAHGTGLGRRAPPIRGTRGPRGWGGMRRGSKKTSVAGGNLRETGGQPWDTLPRSPSSRPPRRGKMFESTPSFRTAPPGASPKVYDGVAGESDRIPTPNLKPPPLLYRGADRKLPARWPERRGARTPEGREGNRGGAGKKAAGGGGRHTATEHKMASPRGRRPYGSSAGPTTTNDRGAPHSHSSSRRNYGNEGPDTGTLGLIAAAPPWLSRPPARNRKGLRNRDGGRPLGGNRRRQ